MRARPSDTYAPEGTCPKCGWTGKDWAFKYRNLCKRCHKEWRDEKAQQRRRLEEVTPKRPLKLGDGLIVTEAVHNRLQRKAARSVGSLPYWLSLIIPLIIAITTIYLMTLVGKSSDSGEALCAIIFGGFILVVLCFDIFQSAWEKRVKAKIIDLAEIRKQEIEEQQRFYNSPEWKDLRRHVLRERPHVCELCGRRIYRENDVTVDHIKPRSKFPELDLDKSNLQVLCRRCNSSKGATYDESSMKLEATPEIPTGSSERA